MAKGKKGSVEEAFAQVEAEAKVETPALEHGAKTAAIKRALAKYPGEKAKQIAKHIKEDDGLDVAINNIYQVMNKGEGKPKANVSSEPGLEELLAFVEKANAAGGVSHVQSVLVEAEAKMQEVKAMLEPLSELGDTERALRLCQMVSKYGALFGQVAKQAEAA